jgi:hypothetical protein
MRTLVHSLSIRRQKKSARYSPYSTSDLSEGNKWSASKFKEEPLANGINITSNLTKTVLKQLD